MENREKWGKLVAKTSVVPPTTIAVKESDDNDDDLNCAEEILWLVLNDLCAESLGDGLEFVFSLDIIPSG